MSPDQPVTHVPGRSLSKGFQVYRISLLAILLAACTSWRSPEEGVDERLARAGREGLTMQLANGATLHLARVEFAELVVRIADSGQAATVLCRAEGQGTLGDARVSYIGGETIELAVGRGGWQPKGPWLPSLAGVLNALAGVPVAAPRSWAVRVERGHAIVSETTAGDAGERVHRYELDRGPEGWRIASGLL